MCCSFTFTHDYKSRLSRNKSPYPHDGINPKKETLLSSVLYLNHKSENERGVVLVVSLLLLFALSLLMVVAVMSTTTDTKIAANYKNSIKAFYEAEAGVQYALYQIESGLEKNSLTLPDPNSKADLGCVAPCKFSFEVTPIKKPETDLYKFCSIGYSGDSRCVIEVGFKRLKRLTTIFRYGIFGNKNIDFKLEAYCLGYDSDENPFETDRANSLGGCNVGSNGTILGRNKIYIDGDVELGDMGTGWEGVFIPLGTPGPIVNGFSGRDVPSIDPDPMNVTTLVPKYIFINDNATNPAIDKNCIALKTDESAKLEAGNYYLEHLYLKNGATLEIDATKGPVNIFMHGPIDAELGSAINWQGKPTDFNIFCDTTDSIRFKHVGNCNGIIYAPFSDVLMYNSANVHGVVWGNNVEIKNGGDFWFDRAIANGNTVLKDTSDVELVSWKQVLD